MNHRGETRKRGIPGHLPSQEKLDAMTFTRAARAAGFNNEYRTHAIDYM
jgi:hypothetical protein